MSKDQWIAEKESIIEGACSGEVSIAEARIFLGSLGLDDDDIEKELRDVMVNRQTLEAAMSDTEILDLIEHYKWSVCPQANGGWVIETSEPIGEMGDANEIELARTRGSLREAVNIAMGAQVDMAIAYS